MYKTRTAVLAVSGLLIATILLVIIASLQVPERREVLQGTAEVTDMRVSCKVPARVAQMRVREGDQVHVGDTLVIMTAPDVEAKLAQAQAAYSAASAQQQKAVRGTREEQVRAAHEMWQKAIAGRELAQKTYERVNRLFEQGVLAEQKRDEAKAQLQAMQATEAAAKSQYDMARKGAQSEDIAAATAMASRAEGAIAEVSAYIDEMVILAQMDGVVTEIFPEVGELVGTGAPIMNIADTRNYWFAFNVREDLLPGLVVGKDTVAYIPAYDKEIRVRVSRIKEVGSFAVWKATKALGGYDLKTLEVRMYPLDPDAIQGIRSGMSAIIR